MSKTDNRIYVPAHERRLVHRALLFLADRMRATVVDHDGGYKGSQPNVVFGCWYARDELLLTAERFAEKEETP